jgi:hypothetical protein
MHFAVLYRAVFPLGRDAAFRLLHPHRLLNPSNRMPDFRDGGNGPAAAEAARQIRADLLLGGCLILFHDRPRHCQGERRRRKDIRAMCFGQKTAYNAGCAYTLPRLVELQPALPYILNR